jgi:hypothetical protein
LKKYLAALILFIKPIVDVVQVFKKSSNIFKYPGFIISFFKYKFNSSEVVEFLDIHPEMNDKRFDNKEVFGQYFYQDNWALNKVFLSNAKEHFDIGSRIDGFVSQCSVFARVNFLDFRAPDLSIRNLNCIGGSILNLPFDDSSIRSLSCLHVIEHIGLGRYGDTVNFNGSIEALIELKRVLSKNGSLYLGVPIGRERVAFNAHRIFNPMTVINTMDGLRLVEFSVVDDDNFFIKNANLSEFNNSRYSLGLFHFKGVD